jgi:hypothetical protein
MYQSEFGDPERNFQIIWFLATYFVNVETGEKGVNFEELETRLHNEYLLPHLDQSEFRINNAGLMYLFICTNIVHSICISGNNQSAYIISKQIEQVFPNFRHVLCLGYP